MNVAAIVPAAGAGKRLGSKTPKAFVRVGGVPLLTLTLKCLRTAYPFKEIIVAARPANIKKYRSLLMAHGLKEAKVVGGGVTRAASVFNAMSAVSKDSEWVLVHDAARPFVDKRLVARLLMEAKKTGAALCALPATGTVKRVDTKKRVLGTEDRKTLYLAQTPQIFRKKLLLDRYLRLGKKAFTATDEAALFDHTQTRVQIVSGDERNIKITTPGDLELAEYYLKRDR